MSFTLGSKIQLADGQDWVLAEPSSENVRAEDFQLLISGLREAENHPEELRAEFALCIELLTRNYELLPIELQELFAFPRNSPELSRFQEHMHAIAVQVCIAAFNSRS